MSSSVTSFGQVASSRCCFIVPATRSGMSPSVNPTAPMPSYAGLPENKKAALVDFLAQLHGESE